MSLYFICTSIPIILHSQCDLNLFLILCFFIFERLGVVTKIHQKFTLLRGRLISENAGGKLTLK